MGQRRKDDLERSMLEVKPQERDFILSLTLGVTVHWERLPHWIAMQSHLCP